MGTPKWSKYCLLGTPKFIDPDNDKVSTTTIPPQTPACPSHQHHIATFTPPELCHHHEPGLQHREPDLRPLPLRNSLQPKPDEVGILAVLVLVLVLVLVVAVVADMQKEQISLEGGGHSGP